jgi:hypothetical protein
MIEGESVHRCNVVSQFAMLDESHFDPREETPLFAAGLNFARETAGPIANAFLNVLPEEWINGHLVIDSTLVWLAPGFRQGEMFWCHEPFPGRTDGVTGQSNQQRQAEHLACCYGQTGIEFLWGDPPELEISDAPLTMNAIQERHHRLQAALESGRLAIHTVSPGTIYRYGWGAFHRHTAATTSGFQFWIRATRGDDRPLVNGIRNATNL